MPVIILNAFVNCASHFAPLSCLSCTCFSKNSQTSHYNLKIKVVVWAKQMQGCFFPLSQDLIDVTYGYDETDPFVDDSEAVSSTLHFVIILLRIWQGLGKCYQSKNGIHLILEECEESTLILLCCLSLDKYTVSLKALPYIQQKLDCLEVL